MEIILFRLFTFYFNNSNNKSLIKKRKFHLKAKYIDIRYFYIRNDIMEVKKIIVKYIFKNNNIINTLTKVLLSKSFERYKRYIGILGNKRI